MGERRVRNAEVEGSIPFSSTTRRRPEGAMARCHGVAVRRSRAIIAIPIQTVSNFALALVRA